MIIECDRCDGKGYTLPLVSLFTAGCAKCHGSGMIETENLKEELKK
jgi:DnaJ-class molecular chaperone